MSESLFLRLLPYHDKALALFKAITDLRIAEYNMSVYSAKSNSFRQIPGSPFSYWVGEYTRRLFITMPKLASEGRDAQSGASTMNDFRFLRTWWEVDAELSARYRKATLHGGRWVPFAKGGVYSPFYIDWELVIDWEHDGEILKKEVSNYRGSRGWGYQWTAAINGYSFYFSPGLTWSRRTTSGISVRVLPEGCIFGDKGPAVFADGRETWRLLALMNSRAFEGLIALQLGAADAAARSYEVGVIERTPIPNLTGFAGERLEKLSRCCVELKRQLDSSNEVSHIFYLPALLQLDRTMLRESVLAWQIRVAQVQQQLTEYQREIDDIAFQLYGITDQDRQAIEELLKNGKQVVEIDDAEKDEESPGEISTESHRLVVDLLSYTVGCLLGRWNVRFAMSEQSAPELPDPFAPLPVCSPGMLTGSDGLPLCETPPESPLAINREGILVDDPNHSDNIVRHVRNVLAVIWKDNAEAVEQEMAQLLRVKELRDYFRRPGNDGFWIDHVKRYSKSRRKAPIYWLLQSSKRNYALWLYYHRLDNDTLFKALTKYVEPKIRLEESHLEQTRMQLASFGTAGREVKQLERQLDHQENLVVELYDFRDKLRRAADLQLAPDLNDGVVLNIAPLWELVPWSEAKKYWEELLVGKYEWSSISKQLRAKGVI